MASILKAPTGWRVRYRTPDGGSRTQTFAKKVDAERFVTQIEHSKLIGGYVDTAAAKVTLDQWWQRYEVEVPRRATTAARDRAVMTRWWLPTLGRRPLNAITPADVRTVVETMSASLAGSTIRTDLAVFRAVMNRAVEAELLARSPIRGIRLPSAHSKQPRFLSLDELNGLADAMPEDYAAMIFVAGVLGLRWSEVAGLRVGRIDFLRRTVTVAETISEVEGRLIVAAPKSKASASTVTAPSELLDMLAEHLARTGRSQPDQLVFTAPEGGPLRRSVFRQRVWLPATTAAGLDRFTFHGLRHSAVGFMIALGAHPRVIQRRARHASMRTTFDVYGSILPEVDEAVAAGLGDMLSSSRVISVSRHDADA